MELRNERNGVGRCVLLVDDDQAVRRAVKLLLTARGYNVHDFCSGADLLAVELPTADCCLVTDYTMPVIDGVTLLTKLRARGWANPAILITGCYHKGLERRARDAGFTALLEKPLTDGRLLELVADCLASASASRSAH